jgi:hypothetical protein
MTNRRSVNSKTGCNGINPRICVFIGQTSGLTSHSPFILHRSALCASLQLERREQIPPVFPVFSGLTRVFTCLITGKAFTREFRTFAMSKIFTNHARTASLGGEISHVLVVSWHRGQICVESPSLGLEVQRRYDAKNTPINTDSHRSIATKPVLHGRRTCRVKKKGLSGQS